jgi:hypothetical protein
MRKQVFCYLFIFIVINFPRLLNGQTTLEEYNYVTKGYKVQIESGLDMKKGYEFTSIDTVSTKIATAEMKILFRLKENKKEIAAYLIVYKREGRNVEYICIPHPKSENEILQKYYSVLWDGLAEASSKGQLISIILSKHLVWRI